MSWRYISTSRAERLAPKAPRMLALTHYARALVFLSIVSLLSPCARAASIEKFMMPGPVTRAHARIEAECSDCHDLANRERHSAQCLGCHKEIAADIRVKSGYHGRMRQAAGSRCSGCHSEHLGRDADITRLSQVGFNHDLTNFALLGAHIAATCESCHETRVAYRKTPSVCSGCHTQDDAHRGALGPDCAACHDARSWQSAHFDHDKTTFALTG